MDIRHLARTLALHVLYELDCTDREVSTIVSPYANLNVFDPDCRTVAYMTFRACYDEELPTPTDDEFLLDDVVLPLSVETYQMLRSLVIGVFERRTLIDELIAEHAPDWPPDQIAIVDRNILRVAIYEMLYDRSPVKVVINEAVEIAKIFGADGAARFVNGVLGSIAENRDTILQKLKSTPSL